MPWTKDCNNLPLKIKKSRPTSLNLFFTVLKVDSMTISSDDSFVTCVQKKVLFQHQ